MGARLKYRANPVRSRTTLTTFGSNTSSTVAIGSQSVATSAAGRAATLVAIWRMSTGGRRGSSACTLTMTVSESIASRSRTSAIRSVPERWSGDVRQVSAPATAPATRSSSTATITRSAPLSQARS